ncbi:conjugal transfer protein TraR [Candidatus Peregrinibacteria bacterium CG_4_10_14_0_2_um_filter_43_11]|nr:MAG: conjugal transfer protein TraR [Candidatus Peregrinibacteria bacterium CG_4_10_14_0_2_um_filter_43_11]
MNSSVVLLLIIVGLLWLIIKASGYFVVSASHIARYFGISELIVGLTIVAIGTSAPEFVVSTLAAAKGQGALSLSNIVGSNIFVLGFTLGFIGIFSSPKTNRTMIYRDCGILLLATFLLYVFLLDGVMARWEGATLLGVLALWFVLLFKVKEDVSIDVIDDQKSASFKEFAILIGSLATILISGNFLVDTSVAFAQLMGVSEWMIGVTIIAIGTSLPEFVTSVVAMMKKKMDMSIGGLIGSGIFNIAGILGTSSLIRPIIPGPVAENSVFLLLVTMVIMTIFLATGRHLKRWEASVLLIIAIVRVILDVMAG